MSPSRVGESARRIALGVALAVAAGVGLDDLQSHPDARRGARDVRLDLPHLGTAAVQIPLASPTGAVLLLHRGASTAARRALTEAVPWHALVVDVDVARLHAPDTSGSCEATAAVLEDISRRAQREAGFTSYLRPVIVSTADALPVATAAIHGASASAFPVAVAVGAATHDLRPRCTDMAARTSTAAATTFASGAGPRWRRAASADAFRAPLDEALGAAARQPRRDTTPVQRWLQHFNLPLTAAWSSEPRGMLVLLSAARGWREPEDLIARQLADAGVHVVGIDALESFWQRRSPREVAFELQRLTDALGSTGLPVYIGGREFGAETMAVAGEMMEPGRNIAGVVLVDPGPRAFFEVEPPALGLRPLGPVEWSTGAAVARLERPTLCITHAPASPAALLCRSLAAQGATVAETRHDAVALTRAIATFIRRR